MNLREDGLLDFPVRVHYARLSFHNISRSLDDQEIHNGDSESCDKSIV
jgi:hypothetical protein